MRDTLAVPVQLDNAEIWKNMPGEGRIGSSPSMGTVLTLVIGVILAGALIVTVASDVTEVGGVASDAANDSRSTIVADDDDDGGGNGDPGDGGNQGGEVTTNDVQDACSQQDDCAGVTAMLTGG